MRSERDEKILDEYMLGKSSYEIADKLNITPRQVQRIVAKVGLTRDKSDSFNLAISRGRMVYHYKPKHLKKHRKRLSDKVRYQILERDNFRCVLCGATAKECHRLEIDHIDDNPSNNKLSNLRVLCDRCNTGRAYRGQ